MVLGNETNLQINNGECERIKDQVFHKVKIRQMVNFDKEQRGVKVSIVIPIYNVEKYLRQCLDSVVAQTLSEIEIICVNDGSTDGSLSIIQEYADKDFRIKVIDKENSGYGHSMNCGFAMARGEYVGIVESDDYADADMFEKLYICAKQNNLDVVKSGYYLYFSTPIEKNEKVEIASRIICNKVLCPRESFKANMEMVEFFNIKPTIWSAIYKRDFLQSHNIQFNETPGASYQDAGFNFKVWACADRVQLMQNAFLHYRQDNEGSSVNSKGKVFCVCDEYEEIERFLNENPVLKGKLEYIKNRIKYDSYMWNYERLDQKYKFIFIERAGLEFKTDMENGTLHKDYFEWYRWKDLMKLIDDPIVYHTEKMMKIGMKRIEQKNRKLTKNYKAGQAVTFIPRKIYGGIKCYREHGLFYTVKRIYQKTVRRIAR